MSRCVLRLVVSVAVLLFCAAAAVAACSPPARDGLTVCFPSVGSTVLYPATIEMAVNSGGVAITHVSVYDGNTLADSLQFVPEQLIDFSMLNGVHHITVNAWDANGKLYQGKSSFTVTGFGYPQCTQGIGAITLCEPAQGSYEADDSTQILAYFAKGWQNWSITLDGYPLISSSQFDAVEQSLIGPLDTITGAAPGKHTLVVSAVDAKGVKSTVTRQFFTYYDFSCAGRSGQCSPGITVAQPSSFGEGAAADVGTSFEVQAEVEGNAKPTTKMIVYLDGKKVGQSTGPGITAEVSTTKGSHYVVIQAWDTSGNLYETYGNVNVE
jgi:hypothetical protein